MGIDARENRRSMTPMPDTGRTSPIARRAGCPSCRTSPIARCAGCPSCRTSPIARRAGCPSACAESRAERVLVDARRAGRVPCETSPRRCPSSAMPRPNMACSRRRHPRFTNIFSFTLPWRCITARSAARLRRGVGRLKYVSHYFKLDFVHNYAYCQNLSRIIGKAYNRKLSRASVKTL